MILAISAFVKIFHVRPISDDLQKVGVGKFMILIGVVELSLAILYIARRSLKLSFIFSLVFFQEPLQLRFHMEEILLCRQCFLRWFG